MKIRGGSEIEMRSFQCPARAGEKTSISFSTPFTQSIFRPVANHEMEIERQAQLCSGAVKIAE